MIDDVLSEGTGGMEGSSHSADARITVLLNHLSSPPGVITGITRYAFGLIDALIRRGDIRLVLVTAWAEDDLPPAISAGVEAVVTLPAVSSTPLNNLRQRRAIPRIARKYGADVIYGLGPTCPPMRGVPSILTVYDFYYELIPKGYKRRNRLWWKIFFPDAARRSDAIAFDSASARDDAIRLHPSLAGKLHVVEGAAVLPQGESPLPGEVEDLSPYLLLLGNVTPNKNVGFAVAALRVLKQEGRPVRALHVGRDLTGDLAAALADDGATLLTSLGSLDDAQLDAVLRNATALVQPSRHEGFGMPVVEAQVRGVPVIATDIPIFREIAAKGSLLVALDDVAGLADAMHTVTTNDVLRADLSEAAMANSVHFGWDKSAEAAAVLIKKLCPSAP